MSDIDIAAVDSLKVLDLNRPIREADIRAVGLSAKCHSRPNCVSTHRSKRRLLFDHLVGTQQNLRLIKLWAAY